MSLATIRARARSRVDQNVPQASGKWSDAWWLDLINQAKDILAQECGFYRKTFQIVVTANSQVSPMPASLCWGLDSLAIEDERIQVRTEMEMDRDFPGWRYHSNFPNQPQGDNIEVLSTAGATGTVTVYGTNSATGLFASEAFTLSGVTPQLGTTLTTWDEIHYMTGDANSDDTLVTLRIHGGGATIATMAIGSQQEGTAPSTGTPIYAVANTSNIEWYPIPDTSYTVFARGAARPVDLSGDADVITGLPLQFEWVVADMAAGLASIADLYASNQQARESYCLGVGADGIRRLKSYIESITGENGGTVGSMRGGGRSPSAVNLPLTP
jgi:hypothetical protein